MSAPHTVSPRTVSAQVPPSNRRQLIVGCCIAYAVPMVLGLLMIILVPPAFWLDPGSSLSSVDNSTGFVTVRWNITVSVKSPHMELLLTFNGQRHLSRPSLVSAFSTQGPDNVTMVRGKALSMLRIEASHGSLTSRCDICLSIGNE